MAIFIDQLSYEEAQQQCNKKMEREALVWIIDRFEGLLLGRFWQVTMVESECSISEGLSENLQKVPEKLIESYFVMVQSKK